MGEVVSVTFGRKPEDGGKARIRRRREALALSAKEILAQVDDLVMHRPDPEMPCDSAFCAPDHDPA